MSKILVYNVLFDDTVSSKLKGVEIASNLVTDSLTLLQSKCRWLNLTIKGTSNIVSELELKFKSLGEQNNILDDGNVQELLDFQTVIRKTEDEMDSLAKASDNLSKIKVELPVVNSEISNPSPEQTLGSSTEQPSSDSSSTEKAKPEFNSSSLFSSDAVGKIETITGGFDKMSGLISDKLAPALGITQGQFAGFFNVIAPILPVLEIVVGVLGTLATVIEVISIATEIWTAIQWLYNAAMAANPIMLIILAIIALIAAIVYVASMTEGWGKTWDNIVKFMSLGFDLFLQGIEIGWLYVKGFFADGFDEIAKGWYSLQKLWDEEGAQKGLDKIEGDSKKRAEELAKAKNKAAALADEMSKMKVWEVKFKEEKKEKKPALAVTPQVPGLTSPTANTNPKANKAVKNTTDAVASGGTRNSQITINLGKMVENIIFQGGVNENRTDIERQLEESLLRVLFAAQSAG